MPAPCNCLQGGSAVRDRSCRLESSSTGGCGRVQMGRPVSSYALFFSAGPPSHNIDTCCFLTRRKTLRIVPALKKTLPGRPFPIVMIAVYAGNNRP